MYYNLKITVVKLLTLFFRKKEKNQETALFEWLKVGETLKTWIMSIICLSYPNDVSDFRN